MTEGGVRRVLLDPLTAGSTYRRFVHLLLGAVLLLPYVAVVTLFVVSLQEPGALDAVGAVLLGGLALVIGTGVALVPGVRTLEITAARALLDARISEPAPDTVDAWPARLRAVGWLLVNLVAGALAALATLIVVPTVVGLALAPWRPLAGLPTGLVSAWAPVAAVALPAVALHAVARGGAGLARLAPRLLGPSTAERLAGELERARRATAAAAHRTRLARELHDSVGHALTVTTLQAGAAARVRDSDPAFVAKALDAIAEAGRTALAELDHVLGVLREDSGANGETADDRAPQPDLRDLDTLLDGARSAGASVTAEVTGDPAALPPAVSREAYRILQESLTNALRHTIPGHAAAVPVRLRVDAGDTQLELEVSNPAAGRAGGGRETGGRGLGGMRERVTVLGGTLTAGRSSHEWHVRARLPVG